MPEGEKKTPTKAEPKPAPKKEDKKTPTKAEAKAEPKPAPKAEAKAEPKTKHPPKLKKDSTKEVAIHTGGTSANIKADVFGSWAVHKDPKSAKFNISDAVSGFEIMKFKKKEAAVYAVRALHEKGLGSIGEGGGSKSPSQGIRSKQKELMAIRDEMHTHEDDKNRKAPWDVEKHDLAVDQARAALAKNAKASGQAKSFAVKAKKQTKSKAMKRASAFSGPNPDKHRDSSPIHQALIERKGGESKFIVTDGHRISVLPYADENPKGPEREGLVLSKKGSWGEIGSTREDLGKDYPDINIALPTKKMFEGSANVQASGLESVADLAIAQSVKAGSRPYLRFVKEAGSDSFTVRAAHGDELSPSHVLSGEPLRMKSEKGTKTKRIELAVNAKYVKDALSGSKDAVKVSFNGARSTLFLDRPDGEKHYIMPIGPRDDYKEEKIEKSFRSSNKQNLKKGKVKMNGHKITWESLVKGKGDERGGHKYIRRKPDGKGGWLYDYGKGHEKKKEEGDDLKVSKKVSAKHAAQMTKYGNIAREERRSSKPDAEKIKHAEAMSSHYYLMKEATKPVSEFLDPKDGGRAKIYSEEHGKRVLVTAEQIKDYRRSILRQLAEGKKNMDAGVDIFADIFSPKK